MNSSEKNKKNITNNNKSNTKNKDIIRSVSTTKFSYPNFSQQKTRKSVDDVNRNNLKIST